MIEVLNNFQTVGGNKKVFSKCQHKITLVARNIHHMVGAPNSKILKMMIRQNIIQNCPFTVEYINIAEKIFGPDASTLKGETTRQIPKALVGDFIEISRELIENNQ